MCVLLSLHCKQKVLQLWGNSFFFSLSFLLLQLVEKKNMSGIKEQVEEFSKKG